MRVYRLLAKSDVSSVVFNLALKTIIILLLLIYLKF